MLGVLLAAGEAAWRLREGVIHAKPASELTYRGCWYGLALAPLGSILVRAGGAGRRTERKVAFDGFEGTMHEDKTERDRRYGTVYTVAEYANAYLVRLEMPRKLPPSSLKRLWNLPDEMPDYDYNIMLGDNVITVSASVRGETIRRLSYVSSSFPADFTIADRVRQAGRCVQASDARQSARGDRSKSGRGPVPTRRLNTPVRSLCLATSL